MSLAIVFPGQGSQSVGMLADLATRHRIVLETFEEASGVLGYDLWQLVQEGPEASLNETQQTQPAMLVAGVAAWRAWEAAGGARPIAVAGHSLGEFSALVCAQSLAFADAVAVVRSRAQFMQAAVPVGQGGIAALLGLDDEGARGLCERVCDALAGKLVCPVNFNAPGQVVIAGHVEAVDAAVAQARDAGAKRAVRLPMSVPVHCDLMTPAAQQFAQVLEGISFQPPNVPVIHNADINSHVDAGDIRRVLVEQLTKPVRWTDTIHALQALGIARMVEAGPGKILSGLIRRIDRGIAGNSLDDIAGFDKAMDAV